MHQALMLTRTDAGAADLAALADSLGIDEEIDWPPAHLAPSAWVEHVPFAFWLVKALRPACIVELGTHWGVSYAAFCHAAERLRLGARAYAVDTWRGDAHAGYYGEEVFAAVSALNAERWSGFSTLVRAEFDAARAQFAAGEIELLHIDGLHTYEAVAHDFRTWRDAVSPRRGVVLFHDTNVRAHDFGVWRLWRELAEEYPHFEFHHGHGLGVLGLGEDLPPALAALFEMQSRPERAARLRALFAARGAAVRQGQALAEAEARLGDRGAALAAAQAEAAAQRLRAARLEAAVELLCTGGARAGAAPPAAIAGDGDDVLAAALAAEERRAAALRAVQDERDALRRQLDAVRRHLDAVLASTSWRLTAPLRAVVDGASPVIRLGRRAARLGYLTLSGRLPGHLREWRARTREWREARANGTAPAALPATAVLRVAPPLPAPGEGPPEHRLAHLESLLEAERGRLDYALGAIEGVTDRIAAYHAARETPEYLAAFEVEEPLVSVCIATVNRAGVLIERAIRSVQAQTYRNLQVIVVGDHTTDDTGARLAALGDPRIRFVNLPERGPYPRPGRARWLVAGTNAMNHALSLCEGHFVTHLDDDDAMTADRIATLVAEARTHRADFLWHPFWWEGPDGEWRRIGDGRIQLGQITTGSIFYHRCFASLGWDVHAYRLDEPGDWNRLRKIRLLRPRLRFVDRPLLYHYAEQRQGPFVAQDGERFLE